MAHVVVLVLGDIGRSPRMQYHALSLSQMKIVNKVTIVGYGGERIIQQLQDDPKVHVRALESINLKRLEVKNSILRAFLKGSYIMLWLLSTLLFDISVYQAIIIQNPPCLPALFVALVASIFNNAKIVLDWHNLGYSIYEYGLKSKSHPLVQLTKFCEHNICRYAHYHICVSKALQSYLEKNCAVAATVVYDRPPTIFQTSQNVTFGGPGERVKFLQRLGIKDIPEIFISARKPALVVSGTSWTADEDFSILLDALIALESFLSDSSKPEIAALNYDSLLCVVTGKGELREMYEGKIAQLCKEKQLGQYVSIHTAWLSFEDYPRLLNSADIGISLHSSSSGLDLPMKVLDMFGSGLPALALDFPALQELVVHDVNGMVFNSAEELFSHLQFSLFSEVGKIRVANWKQHLQHFDRWDTNWNRILLPIFNSILSSVCAPNDE